MDAEIVAMDANGNILPFQELSNRARKDVKLSEVKVLVGVYAFDLMYLDGDVSSFVYLAAVILLTPAYRVFLSNLFV